MGKYVTLRTKLFTSLMMTDSYLTQENLDSRDYNVELNVIEVKKGISNIVKHSTLKEVKEMLRDVENKPKVNNLY